MLSMFSAVPTRLSWAGSPRGDWTSPPTPAESRHPLSWVSSSRGLPNRASPFPKMNLFTYARVRVSCQPVSLENPDEYNGKSKSECTTVLRRLEARRIQNSL